MKLQYGSFLKRSLSALLSLVLLLSLVGAILPIYPVYASGGNPDITGEGSSGNSDGGNKSGGWSDKKSGYRMYIIDANGNIVSNIVDAWFTPPPKSGTDFLTSTKFEPFYAPVNYDSYVYGRSTRVVTTTSDLEAAAETKGSFVLPVIHTGGFVGQGDKLKEWLLSGKSFGGSGSSYNKGEYTSDSGKNNNPNGNSGIKKPTTGSNPQKDKEREDTIKMQSGRMWASVTTVFYKYKGLGFSKLICVVEAQNTSTNLLQAAKSSGLWSSAELAVFASDLSRLMGILKDYPDEAWDSVSGGFNDKTSSNTTKSDDVKKSVNQNTDIKIKDDKRDKLDKVNGQKIGEYIPKSDNFIQVAYADEAPTSGKEATQDGNIYKLLEAKLDGNYYFMLKGFTLDNMSTLNGKPSIAQTIVDNSYVFCIEPMWWLKPSNGQNVTYSKYFAGTVTNWADYITYLSQKKLFNTGSKGGWYNNALNTAGACSLFLKYGVDDPLYAEDGSTVLLHTQEEAYTALTNAAISKKNSGYGIHYYKGKPSAGVPSIPTYDKESPDEEHPAPDGSIFNIKPTSLEEAYIENAKQKPENTGKTDDELLQEYTRTLNIVKCYDVQLQDGTIIHRTTTERNNTPGVINIQHEPKYKVVEWFSSHEYYPMVSGDVAVTVMPDVTWEDMTTTVIQKTLSGSVAVTAETAKKMPAGDTVETVKLGFSCDCRKDHDTVKKDNDPYDDSTLYVRLLYIVEEPSTHTFDYPEGSTPHPAPEPEPPDIFTPEDAYPRDIHIVKTYQTLDKGTGVLAHDGTYNRDANPHIIEIEDEVDYSVTEWFISHQYLNPSHGTTWVDIIANAPITGESGTGPKQITIPTDAGQTTLYILLEREKISAVAPPNQLVVEDLTESQLTKISNTNNTAQGWEGYKFDSYIPAAGTRGGCHCNPCTCESCGCACVMSRAFGDHVVWAKFGIITKDKHETSVVGGSNTHPDFVGKMYGKGGEVADDITFREDNLGDSEKSWSLNSNGASESGIEYITTLSRASVGDKLNIAEYKKTAMDPTSYTRIHSIFSESNYPKDRRLPNGILSETLGYTLGTIDVDDKAVSMCEEKDHSDGGRLVTYDKERSLSGSFKVFTYGGKAAKVANTLPTPMKDFFVQYPDGTSSNSELFITPSAGAKFSFYPYIKMSYMVTKDYISFPGYNADASQSNSRTVYMLSDKKSEITPTNSVEVSWYNKTQADGGYGLQMTSQQWSVHNKATQGSDGWQGVNQVLPGGALYSLATTGTESYIKTVTYNTLVENDSRSWITVSDQTKFTTQSIVKSTQDYLTEAKKVIENYRIVEWVNTDIDLENAWKNESTAVKIAGGGESLYNLGLSTKASTDSKYVLFNGTDNQEKGASEADLDILRENYQTTVYHGFTDHNGQIYISQITVNTDLKMLDQATLDGIVQYLKAVTGTTLSKGSIAGLPSYMTYSCVKIGNKNQPTSTILNALMNNTTYNYLYQLDLKTKFITNLINSVERNTGDDSLNATWSTDNKWYNEAFDGYYEVVQTATYKMGIGAPSRRISILDPNLCPAKASTGNIYTKAHLSQFCLDSKSTIAQNEDNGYVATFEGTKVYLPSLETMFYTRPFFIPNANVQDLT